MQEEAHSMNMMAHGTMDDANDKDNNISSRDLSREEEIKPAEDMAGKDDENLP